MRFRLRPRLAVAAAVLLLAGVSVSLAVGTTTAAGGARDEAAQPIRAVASSDAAPDVDAAPLRLTDRRAPRPADAPLWATLAVLASLATLACAGLVVHRRPSHVATDAVASCGSRAPPVLLAA